MQRIVSPNADRRPKGAEVELIVLHNISLPPNEFGPVDIIRLFTNKLDAKAHPYFATVAHLRVSAHVLIARNADTIQFVPFDQRAWHAGESCYQERQACNDFSIGIELEGSDHIPYSEAQYARLFELLPILCAHYPKLNLERIVGHEHIAPERKTDPGPCFDWTRLRRYFASA